MVLYCSMCGALNPNCSDFCGKCGSPLPKASHKKYTSSTEKLRNGGQEGSEELFNKGFDFLKLGEPEKVLKCFDEALRINLGNDKAWRFKRSALELLSMRE
ncbi:MAG: hypothetical protein QXW47_09890 [Candidatus Jordarchaeales archaeon]